jgi:hypothetical protein
MPLDPAVLFSVTLRGARNVVSCPNEDLTVTNFKTFALAAAAFTSVVFTMPISSRAMPPAAPVKIDAASNGSSIQVHYRRYCRYGRCSARYHRYREYKRSYYDNCPPYYGYYTPYYGADRPCKSHYRPSPYYGYYRRLWLDF